MYYYSTVDGVVLTHSPIIESNNQRTVKLRFEQANDNGFDFAECNLPECIFYKSYGFSEDELLDLVDYAKNNSVLIWDYAQKGGGLNA